MEHPQPIGIIPSTECDNINESSVEIINSNVNTYEQTMKKSESKLKSWEKTIQKAFPSARCLKIIVNHLYITKAQSTMKIHIS
jgi:hypothetical protein